MSDILEEAKERAAFYRDYTRLGARFDPDTGTEAADLIDRLAAELAKSREVEKAAKALADKVDATSECDHKRASCSEIGCIGAEVKAFHAALAAKEAK